MSEAQTLRVLFPAPIDLPFAGKTIKIGRLKFKQKAELQQWLDGLPEPNARVRGYLDGIEATKGKWPLSINAIPYLLDADVNAQSTFFRVAIPPFNPGLSGEEIDRLISDCDSDDEAADVMSAALYGIDPEKTRELKASAPAEPEKKSDDKPPSTTSPA